VQDFRRGHARGSRLRATLPGLGWIVLARRQDALSVLRSPFSLLKPMRFTSWPHLRAQRLLLRVRAIRIFLSFAGRVQRRIIALLLVRGLRRTARKRKWFLDSLLRGSLRIRLAVAVRERLLVLCDCLLAFRMRVRMV